MGRGGGAGASMGRGGGVGASMGRGGGVGASRGAPGSAAPAEVVISVIDDGTGMPEELAAAFDVAPQRRAPSAGAGLGLSIAKAIVEAHGGSIELRRPARGTCFLISLPVEASDRPGTDDGHRDGLTGEGMAMARETEAAGQGLGRHD